MIHNNDKRDREMKLKDILKVVLSVGLVLSLIFIPDYLDVLNVNGDVLSKKVVIQLGENYDLKLYQDLTYSGTFLNNTIITYIVNAGVSSSFTVEYHVYEGSVLYLGKYVIKILEIHTQYIELEIGEGR